MNKQKYFFNNLLLRYRKCLGKLERLKLNGSNERRQSILEKHLRRLENQLRALFQKINRKVIATAMIAGVALLTSADLQAQISYGAQQLNPFSITQIGTGSFQFNPVDFADLDGDGDLDMISADFFGPGYAGSDFFYYENTGTTESPTFAASQVNPFSLVPETALGKTPNFVDLDGDGDFDILAQSNQEADISNPIYGNFYYYENVGTPTAPSFAAEAINPFGLANLALGHPYGNSSVGPGDLDFIDIDNDGDLDIISGSSSGGFHYFENTGTAAAPSFGAEQLNPFNLAALPFGNPNWSNVTFADLDGDGDFDLLSGAYSGDFLFLENVGISSTPDFTASVTNPFNLLAIGEGFSKPTFVDLDNDGDMDIMSGNGFGNFYYMENVSGITNDECAGATPIACGDTVVGTTADNTDTGGANASPDEWYYFTGTAGDITTISLCDGGTDYNSVLTVYDACDGTQIATNDDFCGAQSQLTFTADGTTTYYIAVEGFNTSNFGNFSLAISCITNDVCEGATPVACGETVVGTTLDNTDTGGNPAPDEWYSFTGTVGDITVSLCDGGTSYDSFLRVFDACGGNEITFNDDACGLQSELTFTSDGTTTYYIMVEGYDTFLGNFSLAISCVTNDECAGAIAIACGDTVVGTTTDNTDTGGSSDSLDEWYSFTGTVGEITISLCDGGTDYDSQLSVYHACDGVLIANNNDFCGLQSELTFISDGATTYYIVVEGFSSSDAGNFSLAISCEQLGIEDNVIEGFTFHPNPVNSILELNSKDSIERLEIFNILGQKVINMQVDAISLQMDLSELQTGTYIMKVLVSGKTGTYKVVKK